MRRCNRCRWRLTSEGAARCARCSNRINLLERLRRAFTDKVVADLAALPRAERHEWIDRRVAGLLPRKER